jgi:hypothetical protein
LSEMGQSRPFEHKVGDNHERLTHRTASSR